MQGAERRAAASDRRRQYETLGDGCATRERATVDARDSKGQLGADALQAV